MSAATPVMLPPGRLKLATKPLRAGSGTGANTIGIVVVAAFAARVGPGPPEVMMTAESLWCNHSAVMNPDALPDEMPVRSLCPPDGLHGLRTDWSRCAAGGRRIRTGGRRDA